MSSRNNPSYITYPFTRSRAHYIYCYILYIYLGSPFIRTRAHYCNIIGTLYGELVQRIGAHNISMVLLNNII